MAKPEPMVCPACNEATDWVWDDDVLPADPPSHVPQPQWALDGEWWHSPDNVIPYADTYRCLTKLMYPDHKLIRDAVDTKTCASSP